MFWFNPRLISSAAPANLIEVGEGDNRRAAGDESPFEAEFQHRRSKQKVESKPGVGIWASWFCAMRMPAVGPISNSGFCHARAGRTISSGGAKGLRRSQGSLKPRRWLGFERGYYTRLAAVFLESEFFRSMTERQGQRAQTAKAQVNGAALILHRHVHDGMGRPAVIAFLAFVWIKMNKHSDPFWYGQRTLIGRQHSTELPTSGDRWELKARTQEANQPDKENEGSN
jgi:hypothetical protein